MKLDKKLFIPLILFSASFLFFTGGYSEKIMKLINLTASINTDGDDYAPSVTEDGLTMVFNSRMPQEKSHNIFICRNKDGFWGDPTPVFEINNDSNDETPFISADGKTILFSSDRPGGFSPPVTADGKKRITFDIYISHLVNAKWTDPVILPGDVNTTMNERAPGLSADGKTLFFTRWPYNNPGRSKIFMSVLDGGKFVNVKELPASINSGNFEIGFRPSYKSNKYYFSSIKKGGFGGWDIYYTTLSDKGFTDPVIAGEDTNTAYDDMYYSESKLNSIVCSDRAGGFGGFDLYSTIPAKKVVAEQVKKEYVQKMPSRLRITVRDKKTGKLLKKRAFTVSLIGTREKESVFLRSIEIKSGRKGFFTLNPKVDVDFIIIEPSVKNNNGCRLKIRVLPGQFQEITLYLGNDSLSTEKNGSCAETEIKESKPLTDTDNITLPELKTIYFKLDSSEISIKYIPGLHSIVQFLRDNPEFRITISGHSDPTGPAKYNERLSKKRAGTVADYIKSLDISENRITVKWFGVSGSLSRIKYPRHYSLDRRVDLIIKK